MYSSSGREKRRAERVLYPGGVHVSWNLQAGYPKYAVVKFADISRTGAKIVSPVNIPVREYIAMRAEEINLHGSALVRHCERAPGGKFVIGVEFREKFDLGRLKAQIEAQQAAEEAAAANAATETGEEAELLDSAAEAELGAIVSFETARETARDADGGPSAPVGQEAPAVTEAPKPL